VPEASRLALPVTRRPCSAAWRRITVCCPACVLFRVVTTSAISPLQAISSNANSPVLALLGLLAVRRPRSCASLVVSGRRSSERRHLSRRAHRQSCHEPAVLSVDYSLVVGAWNPADGCARPLRIPESSCTARSPRSGHYGSDRGEASCRSHRFRRQRSAIVPASGDQNYPSKRVKGKCPEASSTRLGHDLPGRATLAQAQTATFAALTQTSQRGPEQRVGPVGQALSVARSQAVWQSGDLALAQQPTRRAPAGRTASGLSRAAIIITTARQASRPLQAREEHPTDQLLLSAAGALQSW